MESPLGCYIWQKVKPINKLVYWQEEINYLYPVLFSVSEIIWREFQNIWSIVVQLNNQKFGLLTFILGELTKFFFFLIEYKSYRTWCPAEVSGILSCQEHENKRKGLSKNVVLPENFCWVLKTVLGFEQAKFCQLSFLPSQTSLAHKLLYWF